MQSALQFECNIENDMILNENGAFKKQIKLKSESDKNSILGLTPSESCFIF